MLRRLKWTYQLYNLFQKDKLAHNVPKYRKLGLRQKYFSSISSTEFAEIEEGSIPEPSRVKNLDEIGLFQSLSADSQSSILGFDEKGYCLLPGYWSDDTVGKVKAEVEQLVETKQLKFKYRNKLMFAIHKSPYLRGLCSEPRLMELLDYLIRGRAHLFQSINFVRGSEQKTHSDSIHMTTFPQGGLLGVWIALEDVDEGNGTIHYYPGSHKLPYFMNGDFGNEGNGLLLGEPGYPAYEKFMEKKVEEYHLQKEIFRAKAGDMFIWHANLLHGGEPHRDKTRTRHSIVLHYFDSHRICYHEITQRPALMGGRS